jgi:hypothetical protein
MTATLTIHLDDSLQPEELNILAAKAVEKATTLDAITLTAVREWIARQPPTPVKAAA